MTLSDKDLFYQQSNRFRAMHVYPEKGFYR